MPMTRLFTCLFYIIIEDYIMIRPRQTNSIKKKLHIDEYKSKITIAKLT